MPCCAGSACDVCARNSIGERDGNKCPICGEVAKTEDLIPYRLIRDKVEKFCQSSGYTKQSLTPPPQQGRPTLPDIVLPTLQGGRSAPPPSPRGTSPPSSSTPPASPGTPLGHHLSPDPDTPCSRRNDRYYAGRRFYRSPGQRARYSQPHPGPTLLPPSHVLSQPIHPQPTFINPSEDPLAAFEAAMLELDAKKASKGRGGSSSSRFKERDYYWQRDYSPRRSGNYGYSRDFSPRRYERGFSVTRHRTPSPCQVNYPSSAYDEVRDDGHRRDPVPVQRRRERCVADIPPETQEERRERERYERDLARREGYQKERGRFLSRNGDNSAQVPTMPPSSFIQRRTGDGERTPTLSPEPLHHGAEKRFHQEMGEENLKERIEPSYPESTRDVTCDDKYKKELVANCYNSGKQENPVALRNEDQNTDDTINSQDVLKDNIEHEHEASRDIINPNSRKVDTYVEIQNKYESDRKQYYVDNAHINPCEKREEKGDDCVNLVDDDQSKSRKEVKKRKSKKSKKRKKNDIEDDDHDDYEVKRRKKKKKSKKKTDVLEKLNKQEVEVRPLVPYGDAEDTKSDDSLENTDDTKVSEASKFKRSFSIARLQTSSLKTDRSVDVACNKPVKKVSFVIENERDTCAQYSRENKEIESLSLAPVSCKWDREGNEVEDPGKLKGESGKYSDTADTQELSQPAKVSQEVAGPQNVLRRALANIIEKNAREKKKLIEQSDVNITYRAKKKKKRRKASSEDESIDGLSKREKKDVNKKLSDLNIPEKAWKKLLKNKMFKKKEIENLIAGERGKKKKRSKDEEERFDGARRNSKRSKERISKHKGDGKSVTKDSEESVVTGQKKRLSCVTEEGREVKSSRGCIQVKLNYNSSKQHKSTVGAKPSLTSTVQEKLMRMAGQAQDRKAAGEDSGPWGSPPRKSVKERLGPVHRDRDREGEDTRRSGKMVRKRSGRGD